MKDQTPYSDNLDILNALITYLAMTDNKSNTPSFIAKSLGLDVSKVKNTLQEFDGLFRESTHSSEEGEKYYTLQLRYSRRWIRGSNSENKPTEALSAEYLDILLNFVTRMVEQEQTTQRQSLSNTATQTAAWIVACVTFIGTLISILVIFLKH
jgi:hypothetical protein